MRWTLASRLNAHDALEPRQVLLAPCSPHQQVDRLHNIFQRRHGRRLVAPRRYSALHH